MRLGEERRKQIKGNNLEYYLSALQENIYANMHVNCGLNLVCFNMSQQQTI